MFDDLPDFKSSAVTLPRNLESLSIDELGAYITALEEEIMRVRQDIEKKKASIAAADAFFRG